MKQLNGTITLSFLEEDNQQRVIFRVVPLCTREGIVFHSQLTEFPDQGSLRVVPDKREQSTFKERMRAMGSLCAIQLCADSKELTKVRQNRNYDPGQGERNQFAIYSDVICEFSDEGVFEVFDEGADYAAALSSHVLLRRGKVLYGPLKKTEDADWSVLRPFGNDCYLLHTVTLTENNTRTFYWNPEMTVNWRQRRGTLRRGRQRADQPMDEATMQRTAEEAAPVEGTVDTPPMQDPPAEQSEPFVKEETPAEPVHDEPAQAEPAQPERPVQLREPEADAALPIGTKLDILDDSISFEEQISKLDQPLSNDANLLSHTVSRTPVAQPDQEPDAPRFAGTPITLTASKLPKPIKRGDTFHNVVEHHIRTAYQEPDSYPTDFEYIDNPIEKLNDALDMVWSEPDVRRQALDALCGNETFTQAFLRQLRMYGQEQTAVQAAQEQLDDIEAERLEMLIRLEALRNSEKSAREALQATLTRKKQDELAKLDDRIHAAQTEVDRLNGILSALGDEAQQRTLETLAQQGAKLFASDGETVALAPTFGEKRTPEEMVDDVRAALGRTGFDCNEDEATELLLYFALFDEFVLCGETLFEATQCAHALLEGLGLMGVTAFTRGDTGLTVASLLAENGQRTPTVEVCASGRATVYAQGHKTIRLMERETVSQVSLPLVFAPELKAGAGEPNGGSPVRPVSLESLNALRPDTSALLPEGEKWLAGLERALENQSASLMPEADLQMRVFIAAASQRLHGGFLAAADAAVLGWVAPVASASYPEALRPSLESLPRSLTALGIL